MTATDPGRVIGYMVVFPPETEEWTAVDWDGHVHVTIHRAWASQAEAKAAGYDEARVAEVILMPDRGDS